MLEKYKSLKFRNYFENKITITTNHFNYLPPKQMKKTPPIDTLPHYPKACSNFESLENNKFYNGF